MNAYTKACDKCGRRLVRGERKKLAMLREIGSGFSSDSFSWYLCPHCASVIEGVLTKWFYGGKQ